MDFMHRVLDARPEARAGTYDVADGEYEALLGRIVAME
jgi:hypothetical protein